MTSRIRFEAQGKSHICSRVTNMTRMSSWGYGDPVPVVEVAFEVRQNSFSSAEADQIFAVILTEDEARELLSRLEAKLGQQ